MCPCLDLEEVFNFLLEYIQTYKIIKLFKGLKETYRGGRNSRLQVLAQRIKLPKWIGDRRVLEFTENNELEICRIYSESKLVIGVGAAIDFMAGSKAPLWMQNCGLKWLFRFAQEPQRLFWRYAMQNSRFIGLLIRQELYGSF